MKSAPALLLVFLSSAASAGEFSGPYIGGDIGARLSTVTNAPQKSPGNHLNVNTISRGGAIGAFGGYLFQSGRVLYGAEIGVDLLDAKSTTDYHPYPALRYRFNGYSPWAASVKARIGYDLDGTLLFVGAGYGVSNVKSYYEQTIYIPGMPGDCVPGIRCIRDRFDTVRPALVLDTGVTRKLAQNIAFRASYSYTGLSTSDNTLKVGTPLRNRFDSHSLRVGFVVQVR